MKVADYPGIEQITRRYQTHDVTHKQVMDTAAVIVATDGRFDVREPQWVELLGRYSGSNSIGPDRDPGLVKHLTNDLVGLMQRPSNQLRMQTAQGSVVYEQRFGHVEALNDAPRLVPGVTLSSQAIKADTERGNRFMLRHNANLGVISTGAEVLALRSARSDTPARLLELLLYGAMQVPGRVAGNRFEFRSVLISGLDLCSIKSFISRVKGVESEDQVLADIELSINHLFADKPYIDRRLADGSMVRLRRPILMELPLSGWARLPRNIAQSRTYNMPAASQLFIDLAHAWSERSDTAGDLGRQMQRCVGTRERRRFLQRCNVDMPGLSPREKLALESLKLMLLGSDSRGCTYTKASDPGNELVLLRHLMVEAGVIPCTQCLSGEDRTLTMISMLMAAHMFERSHGFAYDPRELSANPLFKHEMRELFTHAGDHMGPSPIQCVRGVNGRKKWNLSGGPLGHPVPQAMFLG